MVSATLSLYSVPALLVTLLGFFALTATLLQRRIPKDTNALADRIERMLPLTQCAQCGHPGCRPYAESIANGDAINKCPPGGESTIKALADLLDVEPQPLDADHGVEQAKLALAPGGVTQMIWGGVHLLEGGRNATAPIIDPAEPVQCMISRDGDPGDVRDNGPSRLR